MDEENKELIPIYHVFVDILNETYSKMDRLIYEAKSRSVELGQEIENKTRYILQLLIEKYLTENDIPQIREWRLQSFTKGKTVINIQDIVEMFEPFDRCFLLLSDTRFELLESKQEFSEEAAKFLEENGLKTTLTPDLFDEVQRIIKRFLEKGELYCRNNPGHDKFFAATKDVLFTSFMKFAYDNEGIPFTIDVELLRRIGNELGIVSNEIMINDGRLGIEIIHSLLDMEALIDDYLDGKIKRKSRGYQCIFAVDYIKAYLRFLKNGEGEKARKIVKEFKMRDVINAFHTGKIEFEDLLQIVKSPYFKTNKREVRGLFLLENMSQEEGERFAETHYQPSFHEIFELAQIGLVDDTDIMLIYNRQEEVKEREPSSLLFEKKDSLISREEMLEFFDTKRYLDNFFTNNKQRRTEATIFYITFIIKPLCNENPEKFKKYSKKLIDDERVQKKDIIEIYFLGMFSSALFKEMLDEDPELKECLYEYIKKNLMNSGNLFVLIEEGIIDEWDLIELFPSEEEMKKTIREGIRTGALLFTQFPKVSYLQNTGIAAEEYENSVDIANKKMEDGEVLPDRKFLFDELIGTYFISDDIISIEDIKKAIQDKKDPTFKHPDFNLGRLICEIIVFLNRHMQLPNLVKKIEELYMRSYIIKSELDRLVNAGIITNYQANKICIKFASTEAVKKLNNLDLGESDEIDHDIAPIPTPRPTQNPRKRKKQITRDSLEAKKNDFMMDILKELSFEPVMTKPNSYGISEMQRFEGGNFGEYAVFISKEIPECVVLMHCKQVPYTDIYYQEGGNATYIMEISLFMQYLRTHVMKSGELANFTGKKLDLKTNKLVRTANSSKNWGARVAEKVEDIRQGMGITFLTEHKSEIRDLSEKHDIDPHVVSMMMQVLGRKGKLENRIAVINDLLTELMLIQEESANKKDSEK